MMVLDINGDMILLNVVDLQELIYIYYMLLANYKHY